MEDYSLSFEFFPPANKSGTERLTRLHASLGALSPNFYSVTYGATGANQAGTVSTVLDLNSRSNNISAHISFSNTSNDEVLKLLQNYRQNNVRRLVAILGDIALASTSSGQKRYGVDMVRLIRQHHDDYFHISVAAYPETHPAASSAEDDLQNLKLKMEAGADQSITQFFYRYDAWLEFYERYQVLGIDKPIIAGIMPISARLPSIAERCGAQIPKNILDYIERYGESEAELHRINCDYLVPFCKQLLDSGASGLHFYTMNQEQPTLAICNELNK